MQSPAHYEGKGVLPRLLKRFMELEASSGIAMIACAVLACILANSEMSDWYQDLVYAPVTFGFMEMTATEPLKNWVKDILMVFFFLIIAMELKTEMREGFLSQRGQVRLPLFAALGGVVAPAALYFAFNHPHPELHAGWAVPTATDIAFALTILLLAGSRVPPAAKIFLLAIAIFDDVLAILIIAFFYSGGIDVQALTLAGAGALALLALNRRGVTTLAPYMLVGIYLWFCLYHAGIHTTIAGVLVGMAIPLRDREHPTHSPLKRCMYLLHGWVAFLILPIFAFTAAGVSFADMPLAELMASPIPLSIALALFIGKQIGIFGATFVLVRLRFAPLPEGMRWIHVYGVSLVAGIGFTMSLFIGLLAFADYEVQQLVKAGVIGGSLLSAFAGYIVLRFLAPPSPSTKLENTEH